MVSEDDIYKLKWNLFRVWLKWQYPSTYSMFTLNERLNCFDTWLMVHSEFQVWLVQNNPSFYLLTDSEHLQILKNWLDYFGAIENYEISSI